LDKNDIPQEELLSIQSDSELKYFEEKSRGILYCGPNLDQIVMRFEQLSDGNVCRFGAKWLDSYDKKQQHD
jgi:hypothetical protein